MSEVLRTVLTEAKEALDSDQRFLAVFDLDSTLFDTKDRQLKILLQFAENSKNVSLWPEQTSRLKKIKFEQRDFGIPEGMRRLGFDSEADREFFDAVKNYWQLWFFHNEFLKHDTPIPGAVEFVRALEGLDADVMYLTGRDVPRMLDGTRQSLVDIGFPVEGDHIQICLKPEIAMDDAEFKAGILKKVERAYHRVWLFDNEPVIMNEVARTCPTVNLVFLDTCHSGREALHEELDEIPHFDVDLEDFRQFFIER